MSPAPARSRCWVAWSLNFFASVCDCVSPATFTMIKTMRIQNAFPMIRTTPNIDRLKAARADDPQVWQGGVPAAVGAGVFLRASVFGTLCFNAHFFSDVFCTFSQTKKSSCFLRVLRLKKYVFRLRTKKHCCVLFGWMTIRHHSGVRLSI